MKTVWVFNKKDQFNRFIFNAEHIFDGFYQEIRMYILNFIPNKFKDRVVYFPKVDTFIKHFRKCDKRSDIRKISKNIISDIGDIINIQNMKYKYRYELFKNKWKKNEIKFYKALIKNFPEFKYNTLEVHMSLFGTVGSYNISNYKNKVLIFPRIDRSIEAIFRLAITAFTHKYYFPNYVGFGDKNMLDVNKWREKQKLAQKIANKKEFRDIMTIKTGFLDILEINFSGNLVLESVKYLKELGYPIKSKLKSINNINYLTKKEKEILTKLINKRNDIVTFDEIADVIWKDNVCEKFSLYAIAKLIERIRKKLKQNGIINNLIHTQRGKGYILYD